MSRTDAVGEPDHQQGHQQCPEDALLAKREENSIISIVPDRFGDQGEEQQGQGIAAPAAGMAVALHEQKEEYREGQSANIK